MDFFRNFYNQFFLRDFLGKALPSLLMVIGILSLFEPRFFVQLYSTPISFPQGFLLIGAFWVLGLCLQGLGDILGVFKYFSKSETSGIEDYVLFSIFANDYFKIRHDRYVVIKEASGNIFLCLAVTSIAYFFALISPLFFEVSIFRMPISLSFPLFCIFLILCIAIYVFHKRQIRRQQDFVSAFLTLKNITPDSVASMQK